MFTAKGQLRLVTSAARALLAVERHPNMSQERLGRELDSTLRTVQRLIDMLDEAGVITIDRQTKPYRYIINEDVVVDGIHVGGLLALMRDGAADGH